MGCVSDEQQAVLVVIGGYDRAELVVQGLTHPRLDVEAAAVEDKIVGALTSRPFGLAIVGGTIGRRSPMTLCDAIRLRQQAPVLVLWTEESEGQALAEHRAKQLDGVRYLDLRGLWQQSAEKRIEVGKRIRAQVMEMLAIDEDPDASEQWVLALADPEQSQSSPQEPVDDSTPEAEATPVGSGDPLEKESDGDGPALFSAVVTEEDLDFATRLVDKTRGYNFRAPPPTSGAEPTDAADKKTAKLRERVRELERQLARLASVYGSRRDLFKGAADQLAELKAAVESAQQERASAELRSAQLEGQLLQTAEEDTRLRQELQSKEEARAEQEQRFGALFAQTEETLTEQRQQAAKVAEENKQRLSDQEWKLKQAFQRLEDREAELESLRDAFVEARDRAATELEQTVRTHSERERAASDKASEQAEQSLAERQRLMADQARLNENCNKLEAELLASQQQVASLQQQQQAHAETLQQAQREREAAEESWSSHLEKFKETAASVRESYKEGEKTIAKQAEQLAVLSAKLEERNQGMARLEKAQREITKALQRRSAGGLEEALEGRLTVMEDFAHDASRSNRSQAEKLETVGKRLGEHESLLKNVLEAVERLGEAKAVAKASGAPVSGAPVSGDNGASVAKGPAAAAQGSRWLRQSPLRLGIATAALFGILVLVVVALSWSSEPVPTDMQPADNRESAADTPPSAKAARPLPSSTREAPEADDEHGTAVSGETSVAAAAPDSQDSIPDEPTKAEKADPTPAEVNPTNAAQSEAERKEVRKKMLKAFRQKRWADAIVHGKTLKDRFRLDWEAEFKLAEALREHRKFEEAFAAYQAFLEHHPDTVLADDATFWIAAILHKNGKLDEARSHYLRVSEQKDSSFANKAKLLLRKLPGGK